MAEAPPARPLPPVGLCGGCRHAERIASPRSTFLRCARSAADSRFPRYPALPVLACPGFEPAPDGAGADRGLESRA